MPEKGFKFIFPGNIVVICEHRKQQTLAETTGPQEKQVFAPIFEQRNPIRAVTVEIAF
jgi:hypothetical protein